MSCVALDRDPVAGNDQVGEVWQPDRFGDLLEASDVLSICCPLTPETRHLMNAERLALMKPSAYLINTARGPIVDQKALTAALQNGELAGAGLDVLPGHQACLRLDVVPVSDALSASHAPGTCCR